MNPEHVERIVESHGSDRGGLISILEDIQSRYSYLPEEALRIVARKTGHSLVDVYGIATFFRSFSLTPRGKHLLSACLGTACHVRGGPGIAEEIERQLGIKAGETTPDKEITFETVNCLGACALGPIVVVDGHYFSNVTKGQIKDILHKARVGLDTVDIQTDERIFPVEVSCPRCSHSLMDTSHYVDGYPSIRVTVSFEFKHGWLSLSCLYGSFSVDQEHDIPHGTVVNFFCPHCHAELNGASSCMECSAPMVPMLVRGGGILQICSRRGCKGHMLDLRETLF
jgi:NADH:ubiquinone oxidoreductase subunit E